MKNSKFLTLFILFPMMFSCGVSSNSSSPNESSGDTSMETADITLPISIDLNGDSKEISPLIYGTFIEHIDTCIYNGIWSELIRDRKFHDPVTTGVSQWNATGNVTNVTNIYKSAPNATKLSKGGYIYQNGVALVKDKTYDGYLWASGEGTLEVIVSNSSETLTKTINVSSSSLKKYTFSFAPTTSNNKNKFTIKSTSSDIVVDSISLMPSDNYHGMRLDTLQLLKKLKAPFYRWPGGNFVSGYDWEDGIGDRDERVSKRNLHYAGLESSFASEEERLASDTMKIGSHGFYAIFEPNDYGMDEFIEMCRYLDAEPNIVVNAGFGTKEQAANEVDYCNGTGTQWANKRQSSAPYGVKYWSIGNEMNGTWQLGHVSINEYTARHVAFYNAMKAVDSSIKIIGVGDNWSDWSSKMLQSTQMDYISEHFYATRNETDPVSHINAVKKQAQTRIQKHRDLGYSNVYLAIDEYAYENAECSSRLKDGMGVALALNTFIKNADVVKIACYSSTVNATQGSIATDKTNAYMEGNGYALSLYSNYLQKNSLSIVWQGSKVKDGVFEIVGTINDAKDTITLGVVNSSYQSVELTSSLFKDVVSRAYITAESIEDYDKAGTSKFRMIEEGTQGNVVIPGCSITMVTIHI